MVRFVLLVALLVCSPTSSILADNISSEDMRSLDGQVQEIKSDVLGIASDLNNLEERLLYPTNTQVALFVSMAEGETFRLDAVHIKLDGELATHHIYTYNELEALKKGGVQRIFTGNVTTGEHRLDVTMIGKLKNGENLSESNNFIFAKGVEPKALAITLAGPGLGKARIRVDDW